MTVYDAILSLTNIENAALMGLIDCPLCALTASMLRLELVGSETETDAMERAIKFIECVGTKE